MTPHRRIAIPLYWQRTRLGAQLLEHLTRAVRKIAAETLTPVN
jgi:LysR family transcriptional regulator (chromosome initiation inhibitor)